MAQIRLFWTSTAVQQRNYTFKYWNARNKSNTFSNKLQKRIKERVELLKTHPRLGKKIEFNNSRMLSLGHYSILYKHIDTDIIITGFWDNRQDQTKLLNFIKNN